MSIKTQNSARLLVVSREPSSLGPLWSVGQANAWELEIAGSGCEAMERLQAGATPHLVLIDVPRGETDGFYTLRWLRRVRPSLAIVLLAPEVDPQQRAEAFRMGAQDYLAKPLDAPQLAAMARHYGGANGFAANPVGKKLPASQLTASQPPAYGDGGEAQLDHLGDGTFFLAASPATRKLRSQAELLAQVDVPLLIVGESGSGKETAARLIHQLSARAESAFFSVHCAALSGELLERELLGYEPGAFPGATRSRAGKLELADKGTIFLDDIVEIPGNLQATLLRILHEKEFVRPGGENPVACDVRFIAASSANLEQALAQKRLREDLYYRLSAFTVQAPPLRQRSSEIPLLLAHFMKQLASQYGLPMRTFSRTLIEACQAGAWPGNLRELEGFVKRYLVMGDEQVLLGELRRNGENPAAFPEPGPAVPLEAEEHLSGLRSLLQSVKGEAEKNAIAEALHETRWNRKAAARLLQVSYRTLLYKIQQYRMSPPPSYVPPSFSPQGVIRPKAARSYASAEVTEPSQ